MIFLDTSVLIAVSQTGHIHHRDSLALWDSCLAGSTGVSAHTLAEIYRILTAMPQPMRVSPRNAVLAVETFLLRLTPISLSADEYVEALRKTAALGLSSGMIYDALHVACARKADAERIYTWNVKHFRVVAPDLAERIVTP